jgi:hydroxymethylbilane synthase
VSDRVFVVGTRGSRLALRQTEIVLALLSEAHPRARFESRTFQTEGDRSTASLSTLGGRGVFVAELEQALLRSDIDIAVHSLKDLPSEETPGVTIAATPAREDPRDALVSRGNVPLRDLPEGATVGTGSPRRAAQLLALRPELVIKDIRGNVDTRIRKVEEGQYGAAILAVAGLARLGWLDRAAEILEPEQMLPSVGQGALAVQVRSDDAEALALMSEIDDADTRLAVTAERAFERRLGGGCHAAVAAYGEMIAGSVRLRGLVGDGRGHILRGESTAGAIDLKTVEALGERLARALIEQGAGEMLAAAEAAG